MDQLTLLIYIQMTLYATTAFIALLYACSILCIRRFRETNNIFIANICLSITMSCVYFVSYFPTMMTIHYTPDLCVFYTYLFNLASIAIPYSFVAFTVHRFCIVMYHRQGLFKKKRWTITCIGSFWIIELILSLPFITEYDEYCTMKIWMGFYTFTIAIILPILINISLDTRIFLLIRRSTCRIQAQNLNRTPSITNTSSIKLVRRDIFLLKHMVFTFLIFILGWAPVFLLNLIDIIIPGHIYQIIYCTYLCILSTLGIIAYLFTFNYELRMYLYDRIQCCVER